MMNTNKIKIEMENCKTIEELNSVLKKAIVAFHPDNNLNNMEEATEAFLFVRETYDRMVNRLKGFKPSKQIEKEVAKRNAILRIRRNIQSVKEFFSMDGSEQISVLKGMSARVAIVLDNMTPTPNNRQITDKHHADRNGNFDGMRSYAFVQYVFNKSKTINTERLEEVAQSAWIKLSENATNEKYIGIPFYSLLWISCRQAIHNLYNAEVKHDIWMDRRNDLYDLNAYETKAPTDSHTEPNALHEVWISAMFKDETDRVIYEMTKDGFTETEISEYVGLSIMAVSKRLHNIYDRMQKDRLLEAMNMTENEVGCRKNASAKEVIRILIMKAIRNGMSYKRIAYHLHCEVDEIGKYLAK